MTRWLARSSMVGALLSAGAAIAGDAERSEIPAATLDGTYFAECQFENGSLVSGGCGLFKAESSDGGRAPAAVVPAVCSNEKGEALPFDRWKWPRSSPEVMALRPFDRTAVDRDVRIAIDLDTLVSRLEVRRGTAWIVARVIEGNVPTLTGVLSRPGGYLLRMSLFRPLSKWDVIWSVTDADLDAAAGRRAQARQDAREATRRMREHRESGSGVFAPLPAGSGVTAKEKWERRRRHGVATLVHKWEIVAAYGPLDVTELQDAFWLLAWFESPSRRYEAMRWYGGLRERDPEGSAVLVRELEKDPDSRLLAAFLSTTRDHLRGLPDPTRELISDKALAPLSDDELHWVHRALWGFQAGYRFRDPEVAAYFALLPGYTPMPEGRWKKLVADPRWLENPDAPLLRRTARADPPNANLETILRAEHARRLGAPHL